MEFAHQFAENLKIFGAVSIYWFVSISLVFINKTLLSGRNSNNEGQMLEIPLFVTWFQCIIAVVLYYAVSIGIKCFESNNEMQKKESKQSRILALSQITLDYKIMRKVCPLSIVFVAMMTYNNLCLKHLGVSFYYVGRSLVHLFNVIFTWFILGEKTYARTMCCCAFISLGFLLGVQQEGATGSLSLTGIVYGILSSVFLALNSIYTKKLLADVHQSVWLLGFYNNLNACLLFLPLMVFYGEIPILMSYQGMNESNFWSMMFAGGIFGFAINYAMALQIQMTSPLTNTISGTAKACVQTLLATNWYGEDKPFWWWVSNWVVLFGSGTYARVRQLEMKRVQRTNYSKQELLQEERRPNDAIQEYLIDAGNSDEGNKLKIQIV